MTLNFIYSCRQ